MASGDTLLTFLPENNVPPASNAATRDEINTVEAHSVLDFDAGTTNEGAVFKAVMPQSYADTTGVTILYNYSMSSATVNEIIMQASFERLEVGASATTSGFATAVATAIDTVPGTAGLIGTVSKAHTKGAEMNSVVAGDLFRLKVERNSNSAADDATGDLELHSVEIRET